MDAALGLVVAIRTIAPAETVVESVPPLRERPLPTVTAEAEPAEPLPPYNPLVLGSAVFKLPTVANVSVAAGTVRV